MGHTLRNKGMDRSGMALSLAIVFCLGLWGCGDDIAFDDPSSGTTISGETQIQLSQMAPADLSEEVRFEVAKNFFSTYPGMDKEFGFGLGIVDFMRWESWSGRIDPVTGSEWFRAVNGRMILDILEAQTVLNTATPAASYAVQAWVDYAVYVGNKSNWFWPGYMAYAQALFWNAHQVSLHTAIPLFWDAFDRETALEQAFIEDIVMHNVDYSAISQEDSWKKVFLAYASVAYPLHPWNYSATETDLCIAEKMRIHKIPLAKCYKQEYDNVGLYSTRW